MPPRWRSCTSSGNCSAGTCRCWIARCPPGTWRHWVPARSRVPGSLPTSNAWWPCRRFRGRGSSTRISRVQWKSRRTRGQVATRPGTDDSTLTESRSDQQLEQPRLWRVLLHNDDYTTQDFVVWVLETVFHKPTVEAFDIMLSVHRSGMGIAGVYTHDVAETKLKTTRQLAEEHEFPLLVTMEPE